MCIDYSYYKKVIAMTGLPRVFLFDIKNVKKARNSHKRLTAKGQLFVMNFSI